MHRVIALSVIACGMLAQYAWGADEQRWKTPKWVESHASGDSSTPQFAFDHNGNAVAVWLLLDGESSQVWASRYTASSKTWAPPTQIDASGAASSAAVAVDAVGNALVVWSQSTGIQARRYMADSTLGLITPLQSVTGGSASPQIAYGANGVAFAVWHQLSNGSTQVWANRFVTDHWEGAAQVETNAGSGLFPEVAVDAGGNAVVVWSQSADGSHTDILANRYTVSNHSWNVPTSIETNAGNTFAPQVAVDSGGNARAIWFEFDTNPDTNGSRNRIWSSRYTVNSNSWTPALVESNAGSATAPQVTVAANGNAVAVWQQSDGLRTNIWSSRSATGSDVWDAPVLIETDDTGNAQSPSIAMDANGNAFAVWNQTQPGTSLFGIYAARYTPAATLAGSWAAPALIERDDHGDAVLPRVNFDVNGVAIAVWSQSNGAHSSVISNRYDMVQWGTPAPIEANSGNVFSPELAVDSNGNALAVWAQMNDANNGNNVWSNHYTAGIGWGNAELLQATAGNSLDGSVAFDKNGNAFALWSQWDATAGSIIWSRPYTTSGGWGTAAPISTGGSDFPKIAFDGSGNAQAIWRQWGSIGTDSVVSSPHIAGGAWGTPALRGGIYGSEPQLALDSSGHAIAVWSQGLMGPDTVMSNHFGTGTGAQFQLETQGSGGRPQIAFAPDGTALAIWDQSPGWCGFVWDPCGDTTTHVWWSRYTPTPSGTWSAPQQLQFGNQDSHSVLAVDASGNALVAWLESDGTHTSVWTRRYTGGNWGPPISISAQGGPSLWLADLRIAFDSSGNAVAVWSQSDGTRFNIWANRYTAGGWGTAQLIEHDDAADATSPRLAIDGSGGVVAIWQQSDGTRTNMWANRFE